MSKNAHQILEDPEFQKLKSNKDTISIILTIVELVIYFGFIALVAYNKPFLATKLSDDAAMTIGIPIAIGAIVLSWVLTGVYIFWANSSYDVMVKRVKDRVGG